MKIQACPPLPLPYSRHCWTEAWHPDTIILQYHPSPGLRTSRRTPADQRRELAGSPFASGVITWMRRPLQDLLLVLCFTNCTGWTSSSTDSTLLGPEEGPGRILLWVCWTCFGGEYWTSKKKLRGRQQADSKGCVDSCCVAQIILFITTSMFVLRPGGIKVHILQGAGKYWNVAKLNFAMAAVCSYSKESLSYRRPLISITLVGLTTW
ncbi:hypothetical protein GE09DRAFT_341495 [Coniochaeta sp. 2T2.1]|nr:hypothetical protein GE09DRAFT_341495 [Coniochaeta sp. 2T2.1]